RPQFDFATLDASELSSSELTDKIVENLRGTQPDSGEFIQSTAPILRQKVLNLTPSKKLGMDWKTIDFESEHALSWKVKPTWANETTNSKALKTLREESESADVVSVYDNWVDSSESLKEIDSDLHSSVLKQTREFITLGQEKVINSRDRKSTRLNSSHVSISYAVFCLKKKTKHAMTNRTKEESQT